MSPRKSDSEAGADVFLTVLAIFLPPLAVILKTKGDGIAVGINLLLTILGWIPGVLHAWWIINRSGREGVAIVSEHPARRHSSRRGHSHSGVNYGGSRRYSSRTYHERDSHRRSHSAHRQPAMTYVPASSTRQRSRSRSTTRRYYV